MAAKSSAMKENRIYDDLMTCTICHKYFDDPRLLPCSHTYCFRCIRSEALRTNGDFMCPMKDGTTIQRNQIGSLRVNHGMREVVESHSQSSKPKELSDTDDTGGIASEAEFDEQNAIFISGLPLDMPEQRLFDTLWDIFIRVGEIKFNQGTNKPSIHLFKDKVDRTKLIGSATITFEKEESVVKAIERYNGRCVSILNNVQIYVKKSEPKKSFSFTNSIFISGLPLNMPEQRLFDTLWDIFIRVGEIKFNQGTNKPSIHLFKNKVDRTKLTGSATITFETEESVVKAIEKYNGRCVPILNDAQTFVKKLDVTPKTQTSLPNWRQGERRQDERRQDERRQDERRQGERRQGERPYSPSPLQTGERKPHGEPDTTKIKIWIQFEGRQATRIILNCSSDIDDLIKAALNGRDDRDSYEAYYRNQYLKPGQQVPLDTADNQPVVLRKIITQPTMHRIVDPVVPKPVRKCSND